MDADTLKALNGSIAKWEAIVAGTGVDNGPSNCPLCHMFWRFPNCCKGCPVSEKTGFTGCVNTPYDRYCDDHTIAAAVDELEFLRSLLPSEEEDR
jgi:hypothetical protein